MDGKWNVGLTNENAIWPKKKKSGTVQKISKIHNFSVYSTPFRMCGNPDENRFASHQWMQCHCKVQNTACWVGDKVIKSPISTQWQGTFYVTITGPRPAAEHLPCRTSRALTILFRLFANFQWKTTSQQRLHSTANQPPPQKSRFFFNLLHLLHFRTGVRQKTKTYETVPCE